MSEESNSAEYKELQTFAAYAHLKCGHRALDAGAARRVLEAERMPKESLYKWLDAEGYRWEERAGAWVKKDTIHIFNTDNWA